MAGLGLGSGGGGNRKNRENAQITRDQLRIAWAQRRESLRQWYRRLTKKQPWQ